MLKTILFLLLTTTASAATIEKGDTYQSYNIQLSPGQPAAFKISKRVLTDGCNTYTLIPQVLEAKNEEGFGPQVYVIEPVVIHTEIGCPPETKPVHKTITSDLIDLPRPHDTEAVKLLVPETVRIKFH